MKSFIVAISCCLLISIADAGLLEDLAHRVEGTVNGIRDHVRTSVQNVLDPGRRNSGGWRGGQNYHHGHQHGQDEDCDDNSNGFNRPNNGFGAGQHNNGYGRPNHGYGPPHSAYGPPNYGYGHQNQGYGQPNYGYNQPNQGFGQPNGGYDTPNYGYNNGPYYPNNPNNNQRPNQNRPNNNGGTGNLYPTLPNDNANNPEPNLEEIFGQPNNNGQGIKPGPGNAGIPIKPPGNPAPPVNNKKPDPVVENPETKDDETFDLDIRANFEDNADAATVETDTKMLIDVPESCPDGMKKALNKCRPIV